MMAGKLRHLITVQRATKTQNSYGEDSSSWADLGTYPAWVYSLQGRELESMQQTWAEAKFGISMRYQPEVTFRAEDRIYYIDQNRYLDILSVEDPDGRNVSLQIIAKEYVQ